MILRNKLVNVALGALLTLWSASALAYPTDLQVRPLYGAGSCDSALFAAELKIINTSSSSLTASSVFPELALNASEGEIEAVYPQMFAIISDASGNFVSWTGATIERSPWTFTSELSSDRKVSQMWRVRFDPPSALGANLIPVGGSVSVAVVLRRADGAAPFDVDCDDFSKVSLSADGAFQNDPYFHLIFTSTQQLVCEDLGEHDDPASGLRFSEPFTSGCR